MVSDTQKKILQKIVHTLRGNNIPFQVSGGLAAIAYGAKRPLFDLDIDVNKRDIHKVRELFKDYIVDDFYNLQDKNFDIWLLSLRIDGITVDMTQAENSYYLGKDGTRTRMDADLSKAKIINIEGIEVPVEDKEELISYKKITARDTDLDDIRQISRNH